MMMNFLKAKNFLLNPPTLKIAGLYFFLTAGGLWHILNVLQTTMRLLATPLIIGLALWVAWEYSLILKAQSVELRKIFFYWIWIICIILITFWIEWFGVKSGRIFGSYQYGTTLQPVFQGVPMAIGFAWLVMLLSSTAIWQRLQERLLFKNKFIAATGIASLMVIFDLVMEPAAMKLGYWNWAGNHIPIQNYLAWFIISWSMIYIALKSEIFDKKMPSIAVHAYFAQLVYFFMVILKPL